MIWSDGLAAEDLRASLLAEGRRDCLGSKFLSEKCFRRDLAARHDLPDREQASDALRLHLLSVVAVGGSPGVKSLIGAAYWHRSSRVAVRPWSSA